MIPVPRPPPFAEFTCRVPVGYTVELWMVVTPDIPFQGPSTPAATARELGHGASLYVDGGVAEQPHGRSNTSASSGGNSVTLDLVRAIPVAHLRKRKHEAKGDKTKHVIIQQVPMPKKLQGKKKDIVGVLSGKHVVVPKSAPSRVLPPPGPPVRRPPAPIGRTKEEKPFLLPPPAGPAGRDLRCPVRQWPLAGRPSAKIPAYTHRRLAHPHEVVNEQACAEGRCRGVLRHCRQRWSGASSL